MLRLWVLGSVLATLQAARLVVGGNCPLIGPEFPPPRDLESDAEFQAALQGLTTIFDTIDANNVSGAVNYSYSLQIFSNNPGKPILWEHHHTAPNLAKINSTGVSKVDADTVYRLGSLTKVFTVLAFLAQDGDVHFNEPVTKFIPELLNISDTHDAGRDPVRYVDWEDITIGALASQMSGIIRDYGVLGEITNSLDPSLYPYVGLPPLSDEQLPECGAWPLCNRTQFFAGLATLPPSFRPWGTPAYSNIAYQLLAYALENIAGKPYPAILNETVLVPLNLTHTYYYGAPQSVGIIPGTVNETYWGVYIGDASPSGNMFSSANDISTLGLAILGSRLIKPSLTRRWLQPTAYTADIRAAVGIPWGLRRIPLSDTNPHRTITSFNKGGEIRHYGAILSLLPDWDIGFTILRAGNDTGGSGFGFADLIGASLIPAFDAATRRSADALYSGEYAAREEGGGGGGDGDGGSGEDGGGVPALNSSLVVSTDPSKPGLGVGPWISNGINMMNVVLQLQSGNPYAAVAPAARLYWTGLETVADDGSRRQSFKAVFEDEGLPFPNKTGMFSTTCAAWLSQSGVTYGSLPLDEFVFEVNPEGKVVSVENLALRAKLYKIS